MNRRALIKSAGMAAASLPLRNLSWAGMKYPQYYNPDELGIITGTVRAEMQEDWRTTLQKLGRMGYRFLEGGIPDGVDHKEFAHQIKNAGMQSIALGGSMAAMREDIEKYLLQAQVLETEYIVCYWPWLSSADSPTREETLRAAENLNRLGETVKKAGLKLLWHNHDKEFVDVEGGRVFDILMAETDPSLVAVELDWYWVIKGGAEPVELFHQYPGRFPLAHVKDMNNNKDRGISCVGHGIIDFAPIIKAAPMGGTVRLIVENERAVMGMLCASASLAHLRSILS